MAAGVSSGGALAQTDRKAALIVAQEWERAARRARAEQGDAGRSGWERQFTQNEIAILMGLSERAVREIEKRALRKLKQHPAVRALWREWVGEGATPTVDLGLTDAEVIAVYGLVRTQAERRALDRVMALMVTKTPASSFEWPLGLELDDAVQPGQLISLPIKVFARSG